MRLRPPSDAAEQKATTVNYTVRVPPDTEVRSDSDSGATTVRGIAATVAVRTQSAAITVGGLGADATITTGSGAVSADGVKGTLKVTTSSSGVSAKALERSPGAGAWMCRRGRARLPFTARAAA